MTKLTGRFLWGWLTQLFLLGVMLEEIISPVSADGGGSGGPMLPEVVMTVNGPLRGKMFQSRSGRSYTGFLGIPYSNFSETKRFQTAVPFTMPWEGVRDAMEFGPPCIQYDTIGMSVKGEENCLFLNVFTPVMVQNMTSSSLDFFHHVHSYEWMPKSNETRPPISFLQMTPFAMPVIVFIHGGLGAEFQVGSSSEFGTGRFFMDEDVVLVTMNYRLGPFGFLSTGDGFAMGNMGLKDQVLALEWVRQNIIAFGGDPFRVTIFGEGAGAISTHYMMMSPISQGLFHRAVSLSGTSLDPGTFSSNPMEMSKKLGEILSCSSTGNMSSSMELVSCLRGKDPKEIAEKSSKEFKRWGKDFRIPFAPSFERMGPISLEGNEGFTGEPYPITFLSPLPYSEHLNSGSFNKVPWLIGANKEEGLLQALPLINDGKLLEELNSGWNRVAPNLFLYGDKLPMEALDRLSGEIRKFYFRDAMIGPETKENLTNLFSDLFYLRGMRMATTSQALYGQMVYPFLFDVMGMTSVLSKFGVSDMMKGPAHGDSLQYLFDMANGMESKFEPGSGPEKISMRLIRLWTSFAKLGVPVDEMGIWEPEKSGVGGNPTLWRHISSEMRDNVSESFLERFHFWDYLTAKYSL